MSPVTSTRPMRRACRVLVVLLLAAYTSPLSAQVTPEEHEKHHPGQSQKKETAPGGMMGGMGKSPPKDLYPSLMGMSELSPEQRAEVERQAVDRMRSGTA